MLVANGLRPFVKADIWPEGSRPPGNRPRQRRRAFVAACEKIEVIRRAAAPISAYHPVPAFRFCRFGANVGTPFLSDGAPIRDKLMGLRLGHFGGFLKTEWRDYDWMWGRLDGATHLVMMLLDRLKAKPALPVVQLRNDLHAWVGPAYSKSLDAALDAFLAAPDPPATPGRVITDVTLELVRPLHRAIFCSELNLDPATGLDRCTQVTGPAPSLPEIDARITKRLEEFTKDVTDVDVAAMADSDAGRVVIGQLGGAGLRALGDDPALPAKARLRPALRGLADVVLAVTQRGPVRWLARGLYIAAIVALLAVPIVLNLLHFGAWWAQLGTAICALVLGVLLAALILVFPARAAGSIRRVAGWIGGGRATSLIEREVRKVP